MNPIERTIRKVDDFQQRNRALAFPFAVLKKFGDDRAGYLAALCAYYGFFSLFPLLFVFVSVLGLVLRGDPQLQQKIVHSTIGQFPVVSSYIKVTPSTSGSIAVLVVSSVTALWAGLGWTAAMQNAMNDVWDVPLAERPNFFLTRLRSLLMLVLMGTFVLASTLLAGLGVTKGDLGALRVVGFAGSLVVNVALYLIAFRVLTRKNLSWGAVFPGAVFSAVVWTILQLVGNYYVTHQIAGAKALYGTFAVVLGLLVWLSIGAQVSLYGAEINVVRANRLWPRSLMQPPLSEGDKRAYAHEAQVERHRPEQEIDVGFEDQSEQEDRAQAAEAARETDPDRKPPSDRDDAPDGADGRLHHSSAARPAS
jgi:YihY family inner membrane protein